MSTQGGDTLTHSLNDSLTHPPTHSLTGCAPWWCVARWRARRRPPRTVRLGGEGRWNRRLWAGSRAASLWHQSSRDGPLGPKAALSKRAGFWSGGVGRMDRWSKGTLSVLRRRSEA